MKLMRHLHVYTLVLLAVGLASCTQLGYEKPRTFKEEVAYTDAAIGAAAESVAGITCDKYVSGACATPGRPLHPAVAKGYLDNLDRGHQAAKAASSMPSTGGSCLGTSSTPQACLQIATLVLQQAQSLLRQFANETGAK